TRKFQHTQENQFSSFPTSLLQKFPLVHLKSDATSPGRFDHPLVEGNGAALLDSPNRVHRSWSCDREKSK
ncbi:unnamed protein product, partial [Linum tenue]